MNVVNANEQQQLIKRWRYPALLIFLLGGILGTGLNVAATVACHLLLGWPAELAFFCGTIINQLFHHLYYHVVHINQEIRLKLPRPVLFLFYLVVALVAAALLHLAMIFGGLSFMTALFVCLALLSLANILINRISTFSSAKLATIAYQEVDGDFYDEQTDDERVSRFRAWYHSSRYEKLTRFVQQHYKPGMKVADLGCGNCLWNAKTHYPVLGVDINEKMLRWATDHERLTEYVVRSDLADTSIETGSMDIVIMSEVLEHVFDFEEVLAEVRRITADDGTVLITVPYDFFLGPFFVLFNLNCLYMWLIRGSQYHKYRCGHIHHFTKRRLRAALEAAGLTVDELFAVNGLLLYCAASKKVSA